MLIDNRMMFLDAEPLAVGLAAGSLDLYGQEIPVYPDSNLDENNARGSGTPVLVHAVTRADDGEAEGEWTITLAGGDDGTTFPNVYAVITAPAYAGNNRKGSHMVFAMPYTQENRYVEVSIDASGVSGLGANPVADAWLFVQ